MASKVTLINLAKVDSTITNDLNTNFTRLADAIDDALDRTGASPNQLEDDVDANDYEIVNLGAPQNNSSAARLQDILSEQTSITDIDAVSFNSKLYSDLKGLKPATLSDGDVRYVRGRSSVGDGGEGHFRWDSSDLSTEVTNDSNQAIYVPPDGEDGSNGAWVRQSGAIDKDVTLSVPSTFSTHQEALDYTSHFYPVEGAKVTINVEAGHSPDTGIFLAGGDYSHVTLTADDAEVIVTINNVAGTGFTDSSFWWFEDCHAPKLDFLMDAQQSGGTGGAGITVRGANASMQVTPGSGIKNVADPATLTNGARGYCMYAWNGATVRMNGAVFTGSARKNLRLSRGAYVTAAGANLSGSLGTNAFDDQSGNVDVSRGSYLSMEDDAGANPADCSGAVNRGISCRRSIVQAETVDCSDCGADAISIRLGSWANIQSAQCSGAGSRGLVATQGSWVNAEDADFSNSSDVGIFADSSTVNAKGADLSGVGGSVAIQQFNGSIINAQGVTQTAGFSEPENAVTDDGILFTGNKTHNWGNTETQNDRNIFHGLSSAPSYADVQASVSGHIATVSSVDDTNITIELVDDSGAAVTTDETIYWEARV